MHYACKFCIAMYGLKGSEIATLAQSEEEVARHIIDRHGYPRRSALAVLMQHFGRATTTVVHTADIIENTGPIIEVSRLEG